MIVVPLPEIQFRGNKSTNSFGQLLKREAFVIFNKHRKLKIINNHHLIYVI